MAKRRCVVRTQEVETVMGIVHEQIETTHWKRKLCKVNKNNLQKTHISDPLRYQNLDTCSTKLYSVY